MCHDLLTSEERAPISVKPHATNADKHRNAHDTTHTRQTLLGRCSPHLPHLRNASLSKKQIAQIVRVKDPYLLWHATNYHNSGSISRKNDLRNANNPKLHVATAGPPSSTTLHSQPQAIAETKRSQQRAHNTWRQQACQTIPGTLNRGSFVSNENGLPKYLIPVVEPALGPTL